jgi:hypothetical protein
MKRLVLTARLSALLGGVVFGGSVMGACSNAPDSSSAPEKTATVSSADGYACAGGGLLPPSNICSVLNVCFRNGQTLCGDAEASCFANGGNPYYDVSTIEGKGCWCMFECMPPGAPTPPPPTICAFVGGDCSNVPCCFPDVDTCDDGLCTDTPPPPPPSPPGCCACSVEGAGCEWDGDCCQSGDYPLQCAWGVCQYTGG